MEKQIFLFDTDKSINKEIKKQKLIVDRNPIIVTEAYDTFWKFAYERQEVFYKRLLNMPYPWTDDPIIKEYKFTNVYRACDRVSQYLIKNVIYKKKRDALDTFFRIILFKIFNKIETWELLERYFGDITYSRYNFHKYNQILTDTMQNKETIYSAAYIMPSARLDKSFNRKHTNHLKLIELMIKEKAHIRITNSKSLEEVYKILISYPLIGQFLAYQFAIDINYSELVNYSENDFVVPGPGAINGIKKCFISTGSLKPSEIIEFMKNRQDEEFERLKLKFKNLWGRALQLIDIQNLFCEVDKYSRIAHPEIQGVINRKKIKQKYQVSYKNNIEYFFPPKWEINVKI